MDRMPPPTHYDTDAPRDPHDANRAPQPPQHAPHPDRSDPAATPATPENAPGLAGRRRGRLNASIGCVVVPILLIAASLLAYWLFR